MDERREGARRARDQRVMGAAAAGLAALWTALAVYAAHAALPRNPIVLPLEDKINTQLWFPQGWRFFTRDAREEDRYPVARGEDGVWRQASAAPNFQARHVFGWSRDGRAQGVELGLLLNAAGDAEATACKGSPEECLEGASHVVTLKNESPHPTLCGDIGVVYHKPVPWAWARSGQTTMRSRVLRMRVTC